MNASEPSPVPADVQVACLCAAWCGVCREYEPPFAELSRRYPGVHFDWVDVEDEADWVDELDVENFPTVLIGVGGKPVFYGTVLPHIHTLERLVQDAGLLRPLSNTPEAGVLRQLLTELKRRAGVD